MTRSKKARPKATADDPEANKRRAVDEIRWINPTPNQQDIEWLESNTLSAMEDLIAVFEGLQVGQRLTCKFDTRTSRWVAVLFDNPVSGQAATPALSVRGATSLDALLLLGYCVTHKYPDGWQETASNPHSRFG